jgi:Asp-tRNA(Asn)/Glu-tRNA(Gln) amidotransferase C subunit
MVAHDEELTAKALEAAARLAGFALDEQHRDALLLQVRQLLGRLDQLRELDLGAVEPAFIAPLPPR